MLGMEGEEGGEKRGKGDFGMVWGRGKEKEEPGDLLKIMLMQDNVVLLFLSFPN